MAGATTFAVQASARPSAFRHFSWRAAAVAVFALHTAVSIFSRHSFALSAFGDLAQCAILALAVGVMAQNTVRAAGRLRVFWLLMTSGVVMWFISTALWTFYELVLRREVPNPFIGDIVLFLHVVPLMAAIILHPHRAHPRRYATLGVIDLALLVGWWLYLYLLVVIPWQYVQVDRSTYGSDFDRVYLVENLLFMGVSAAAVWRSNGAWRKFYLQWFGAGALYMVASLLAGAAIDAGRYYTGSWYDLPLIAVVAWIVCTAASGANLRPERQAQGITAKPPFWAARLASLAVLSIPLLAWFFIVETGAPATVVHYRLVLTLISLFAISATVFYKQHLFNGELVKLANEAHESYEHLRQVQNQLVQSEKLAALGQLVAGAAHEINNPLTAIIGYCDLMPESGADPVGLAQKIGQQARRTKALVENLLSFGRQAPANKIPLDLNSVVSSALRLLNADLVQHRITARVESDASLPTVLADANQILQVIMQIIRNAIDAVSELGGGELTIRTRKDGARVLLEVSDSGSGIRAPEKVFDPFYTTKPVGKGTGLGLSTAYGIIQRHDGEIACQNNPAGGATFRITLPAESPA